MLRDLIAENPAAWVGSDLEAAVSESDTGMLVKLLEARQRLPIHVHPTRGFRQPISTVLMGRPKRGMSSAPSPVRPFISDGRPLWIATNSTVAVTPRTALGC